MKSLKDRSIDQLKRKVKWPLKFIAKKQARFTDNNQISIYHDGSLAFPAMWDSIAKAKKRVWLETFILDPDRVGSKTIDLLLEAATRGCDVCDDVPSQFSIFYLM
jgi:cardiolipin synthase